MGLIDDTTIALIGNEFLIMEMEKYAQVFESKRGKEILQKLIEKIIEVWSISKAIEEFRI